MTRWRRRKRAGEAGADTPAGDPYGAGVVAERPAESPPERPDSGREAEGFGLSFVVTEERAVGVSVLRLADRYDRAPASVDDFLEAVSGRTYEHGLYRFHDAESSMRMVPLLGQAFPTFPEDRRVPFAYDWLGRQFTLDPSRPDPARGEPLVLMFEVAAGQAFEIPHTFHQFHQELPTTLRQGALAADLFEQWRAEAGVADLARGQCAGYRVPLFLGGRDNIANLELTGIDVYLDLTGQLAAQTRHLPEGASITQVKRT